MSKAKTISIHKRLSFPWFLFILVVTAGLALSWTGMNDLEQRVVTNRFFLFSFVALIAFLTPYFLFPDRNMVLIQLGNYSSPAIREKILMKVWRYSWPVYFFIFILFFGDLETPFANLLDKMILFGQSIFLITGVIFLSIVRYCKSGVSSQFWKESAKKDTKKIFSEYLKYQQVDPSSLPSLINTIIIFSTGSVAIVIGATIQQEYGLYFELIFYLIVFVFGLYYLRKHTPGLDRNYYASNAFFREFFGDTVRGETVLSKREVEQLWWVPGRLKMHVWQFLLQIDRKIPAGRAVAAGHVAVLFIAYQRPEPQFLTVIWILFALAHQLFTILSFQKEMAPNWILRWIDRSLIWMLSRFWMQLRWVLPLLLSMNLQYFLFGVPAYREQSIILFIYLIGSLFVSIAGTYKLKQDLKT